MPWSDAGSVLQSENAESSDGDTLGSDDDDDESPFIPADVMHMTVLSRVLEVLRFTVGPSLLQQKVTLQTLKAAFTAHAALDKSTILSSSQAAAKSPTASFREGAEDNEKTASNSVLQETAMRSRAVILADVHKRLDLLWAVIERDHSTPLDITFGDVFDYEFPSFPESTEEQRETLRGLCDREVVTVADVTSALDIDAGEQIIEFIFASGSSVIPREVFKDIVGCLDQHPRVNNFAQTYVARVAHTGLTMQSFLLHLAVVILVLATSPSIVRADHLELFDDVEHWFTHEWRQGCPAGPTNSTVGCYFQRQSFASVMRPELDATRYLRSEMIDLLWRTTLHEEPGSVLAPGSPLGGAWPVGALLIRGTREGRTGAVSCADQNLSSSTPHWEVPALYGCTSDWAFTVPFNRSREAALKLVSDIQMAGPDQYDSNYAIVVNAVFIQPSTSLIARVEAIVTFPRGGGTAPRLAINTIDSTIADIVFPWVVLKFIGTSWALLRSAMYSRARVFTVIELTIDVVLAACVAVAYYLISAATVPHEHLGQLDYFPSHVDDATWNFNTGMTFLGVFVLGIVMTSVQYTFNIMGLQLLPDILKAAFIEIFALIFMFFVWSFGFICIAMTIFGPTETGYASLTEASRNILLHFAEVQDFNGFAENFPIVGPAFFFVLNLYVVFFALHLLIAVIEAPLEEVNKKSEFPERIFKEAVLLGGSNAPWYFAYKYKFIRAFVWPVVNVVFDSLPFTQHHWIALSRSMISFYQVPNSNRMEVAHEMTLNAYDVLSRASLPQTPKKSTGGASGPDAPFAPKAVLRTHLWESPLVDAVVQSKVFDDIALAFVVIAIQTENRWNVCRDARLMAALREYDESREQLERVIHIQKALQKEARMHSDRLVGMFNRQAMHEGASPNESPPHSFRAGDKTASPSPSPPAPLLHSMSLVHEASARFAPTKRSRILFFMQSLLAQNSRFAAYFVLTIMFTCIIFIPFANTFYPSAFLARSLHLGLRDSWITNRCYDAECKDAWTVNKTFSGIEDIEELNLWFEGVLIPQLFDITRPDAGFEEDPFVKWDSRIRRRGPIVFRQSRAPLAASCPHFAPEALLERLDEEHYSCESPLVSNFDTNPMPVPSEGAVLPLPAYQYSSRCPWLNDMTYLGRYRDYPCRGYVTTVDSVEDMETLINSSWIDSQTRLVGLAVNFSYANDTHVEYSMFVEAGENGAGMKSKTFVTIISIASDVTDGWGPNIMFRVLLGIDILVFTVLAVRYSVYRWLMRLPREAYEHRRPSAPWIEVLLFIASFTSSLYLRYHDAQTLNTTIAVMYMMYHLTTTVVFPSATLMSKKMQQLTRALWKAIKRCFNVVPFFVAALWGFLLCAYIIFGRFVPKFGRIRWSLQTVGAMALTGDLDLGEIQAARYIESQVFTSAFFALILVMLSNLFLAMVTSATMEAAEDEKAVTLSEDVLRMFGYRPLYGRFVAWFIYISRRLARSQRSAKARWLPESLRRTRPREAAVMFHEGRALFPTEVLMTAMSPLRINELLDYFHVDQINVAAYGALCPFLLECNLQFRSLSANRVAEDDLALKHEEEACVRLNQGVTLAPVLTKGRKNAPQALHPQLFPKTSHRMAARGGLASPPKDRTSRRVSVEVDNAIAALKRKDDPSIATAPPPSSGAFKARAQSLSQFDHAVPQFITFDVPETTTPAAPRPAANAGRLRLRALSSDDSREMSPMPVSPQAPPSMDKPVPQMTPADIAVVLRSLYLDHYITPLRWLDGATLDQFTMPQLRRLFNGDDEAASVMHVWRLAHRRRSFPAPASTGGRLDDPLL